MIEGAHHRQPFGVGPWSRHPEALVAALSGAALLLLPGALFGLPRARRFDCRVDGALAETRSVAGEIPETLGFFCASVRL